MVQHRSVPCIVAALHNETGCSDDAHCFCLHTVTQGDDNILLDRLGGGMVTARGSRGIERYKEVGNGNAVFKGIGTWASGKRGMGVRCFFKKYVADITFILQSE